MVAGAATLLIIHGVAAVALGLYIGRYGMTRDGLTLQGPGNMRQLPPDQAPDQVPARPPIPGEPTVLGRIRRIDSGMLDLATMGGPRQVLFDEQTKVWDRTGEVTSLDRLAEGQFVAILGVFHNGGQHLEADLIIILPNLQELREPSGQGPRRPAGNP
jgi:hypothetical protein